MVDQDKSFTIEERQQIVNGIKSLGKLSGVIALLFIYTPKRIFGLFGKLAKLLSLKTVIGYEVLKKAVNKNGSKAVRILSNASQDLTSLLWRWVKISLIVLLIYSVITIVGLIFKSSFVIALIGIVTAIYFLVVCYILEKGIMAIFASYDIGRELLLDILHIPKSVLNSVGINFRENQTVVSEEKIRDSFKDLRFVSVIVANISFLLALFPYWSWVGALAVIGIGALGLSLLHFWQPSWTPTFWTWFRRLSTIALIFLVLIFTLKSTAEYFYPETIKALTIIQSNSDRKYAKELLDSRKPVQPRVITKIVEKVVVKNVTTSSKPQVIAIPVSKPVARTVVRRVVIPQTFTPRVDNGWQDKLREAALAAQKVKQRMELDISGVKNKKSNRLAKKKIKVVIHDSPLALNSKIRPRVIPIPR